MNELEIKFMKALRAANNEAYRSCNGYIPHRFNQMLDEHGAVETARRLLSTSAVSEGLTTLFLCNRLDLTLEAFVVKKEFQPLFTLEELQIAKQRLQELGIKLEGVE